MSGLESTLREIWFVMGTHLWKSGLLLAVLFALGPRLRYAPGRYEHRLWWAALVKLVLPLPLLQPAARFLTTSILGGDGPPSAVSLTTTLRVILDPLGTAGGSRAAGSAPGGVFWTVLTGLWAVGALGVFWRGLRGVGSANARRCVPCHAAPADVRSRIEAAIAGRESPSRGSVSMAPVTCPSSKAY